MGKQAGLPGRIKGAFLLAAPGSKAAVTVAEIAAGIDIVGAADDEELATINGFVGNASTLDTPGMASTKSGNVAGRTTYPQSSLSFYVGTVSSAIRTGLTDGLEGYVVFGYDGLDAADKYELFPCQVTNNERQKGSGDSADMFDVTFAIQPPTDGTVAA